jgi:hypothetical protein
VEELMATQIIRWTCLIVVALPAVALADASARPPAVGDKSIVVWATVADQSQRGGSLLTLQEDERFDALVYGERVPARWMAGSDFFRRTREEAAQAKCQAEEAGPAELVQMAVVYSGHRITLYRNAVEYSSHDVAGPQRFDDYAVMLGLRYLGNMGAIGFYAGDIEEARLYNVALAASDLGKLRLNQPSDPAPIGWWTFEDGTAKDAAGRFPTGVLMGDARIAGGRLSLNGTSAYLLIERSATEPQGMFYRPRSRATGRMWDTWLYYREGTYYLYCLANCGNSWDNVSLATSADGVHWDDRGPVLRKRPDAVWLGTGSTWKSPQPGEDGRFYLNFSEWRGKQQTIFFAESTDLVHWQRLDDRYEFKPDARWYNVDEENNSRWDCIYTIPRAGGGLFGYWTATPKADTRGRFGFGETTDGITWRALPPPIVQRVDAGEVGAIERIGERYYMIFGTGGIMVTLVADRPEGPFVPAERNCALLSGHTYFARFFPSPEGLLVNHHSIARDTVCFAPLKATRVDQHGTLRLAWWPGNEKFKQDQVDIAFPTAVAPAGNPLPLSDALDVARGAIVEGTLALPAAPEAQRNGLYIECEAGQGVAILVDSAGVTEIGPMRADGSGFQCDKRVDRQWPFGPAARFRLLLKGPFLEFYLDDLLVECYSINLPEPATGRIGAICGAGVQCVSDVKAW